MSTLLLILSGCRPEELGEAPHTTNEFYDKPGQVVFEPRLPVAPNGQDKAAAEAKSVGCISCHKGIENPSMHANPKAIGCSDCHGGNPNCFDKEGAHVHPRGEWYSQTPSSTPPRKRLPGQPALEEKKEKAAEKKSPTLPAPRRRSGSRCDSSSDALREVAADRRVIQARWRGSVT